MDSGWNDVYVLHCQFQIKPHLSPWFSIACAAAMVHRNHFFARTNRINLLNLKESSDRLVIIAKGFLKLPNLHDAIKAKAFIICQKLGCLNFLQIANSVLNKGKSAIPPLYNAMVCI